MEVLRLLPGPLSLHFNKMPWGFVRTLQFGKSLSGGVVPDHLQNKYTLFLFQITLNTFVILLSRQCIDLFQSCECKQVVTSMDFISG